ncbi:MAG: acetyl-CoA carboxylase, carboxyl transferase, alpha subunit [Myxococcales bacterium]|nr:acetyl-CoA carboxylase, carboxyl transferase, alpha subunit [Myxococcales bacterium]
MPPVIDTRQALDFERPIVELENRIAELKSLGGPQLEIEIRRLERKARQLQREVFSELSAWQKVLLSRHPLRPFTLDYVGRLCEDWIELHGDRAFRDDESIVGGVARFRGRPVMILGHQKGRGTKENMRRNFGMTRPEGYRKALRLMKMASRLGLPILTFIDTPGAYPGIDAEERGQAEAIAKNLEVMSRLPVPIIATVIGEGGSGGALALGVADRILMLEYSVYSVISPEGCASILWKDQKKVETAAREMKMTAPDLLELGVADALVPEPAGGAHRDPEAAADAVGEAIARELSALSSLSPEARVEARYQKFRRMGSFLESGPGA